MSTDMLINFVLDQSGSMGIVRDATIEGFNAFLHEQQGVEGNAWMSLTLFSTTFDVRYTAWGIKDMPDMDKVGANSYAPNGGTALFDAVGTTIEGTERWLDNNKDWFHGKILTDGQENSSTRYTQDQINELIKRKQDEGWEFVFLGAGGSAWLEQTFVTVDRARFYSYDNNAGATMDSYTSLSASVGATRTTGAEFNSEMQKNFKDKRKKDAKK